MSRFSKLSMHGIFEYQLTQSLPEEFKSSLPSLEEIEAEFAGGLGELL